MARTLNVYVVAFLRPVTTWVTAVLLKIFVTLGCLLIDATTVYWSIGEPWFAGAFHVTFAFRLIGVAVGFAGAAGFVGAAPAGVIVAIIPSASAVLVNTATPTLRA